MKSYNITVNAKKTIIHDSADHKKPKGAICDNYSSQALLNEVHRHIQKDEISLLDLGCAGGQFVRDAHDRGWISVGLEGSDSVLRGKGSDNWSFLQDKHLFFADISEPYQIMQDGENLKFDFIHSEEVLEHINEDKIDMVLQNVRNHLRENGIFFLGIAMFPDEEVIDGELFIYHVCVHNKHWWKRKIEENGFEILKDGRNDDSHAGFIFKSKVRDHQESLYICAKLKQHQETNDCF